MSQVREQLKKHHIALSHFLAVATKNNLDLFAIIDGAVNVTIHEKIVSTLLINDRANLFQHTPFYNVKDAAPYLIRVKMSEAIVSMFSDIWGTSWGVFLYSNASINKLSQHLTEYLIVKDPLGEQLMFRFYDPRILPVFIESCNKEELKSFFGPITNMFVSPSFEKYN